MEGVGNKASAEIVKRLTEYLRNKIIEEEQKNEKITVFAFNAFAGLARSAQETAQASTETASDVSAAAPQDPAERNRMLYSLGFLLGDN